MRRLSNAVPIAVFSTAPVLATAITVLICGTLLAWVQFSFDGMYDGDSYFHTRAARELADHGIRRTFPQTAFSTWNGRYSDKDFLFHAILIPFQGGDGGEDLVGPGKRAAVLMGFALLAAVAFSLRATGARFVPLWILFLFSMHAAVTGHLLAVRPHTLGVALLVLEAALLLRGSVWGVGVLGMLHVYAHSSFPLLAALAACRVGVSWLRREAVPWRTAGAAIGGIVGGSLLHPWFPNNLAIARQQTLEVARNVWSGSPAIPPELFGSELVAASTSDFLSCFSGWAPAALGLAAWLVARRPRPLSTETLSLLAMNVVLGGLSFLSARFLAFWMPLSILLAGRLWTEIAAERPLRVLWSERRREVALSAGILVACLGAAQVEGSVFALRDRARGLYTRSAERPAVEFLRRNAPSGELVYHNFWWDFSTLYHYRPEGRYIVALDPVFLYMHDRRRFEAMLDLYRGERRDAYAVVAETFGARWVYVGRTRRSPPFLDAVGSDRRFERVYADPNALVYRVRTD